MSSLRMSSCSKTLPSWPRGASGRPHNFKARGAVSAKVDLVSINAGIIGRKTWLQDGAGAITAVAGLRWPLPCNYPPPRCGAAPGVCARWQGQGQESPDAIQPPGASGT